MSNSLLSPIRLWVYAQMNSTSDDDLGPEILIHYSVEGIVDGDGNEVSDNYRPIFCWSTEEILILIDGILSVSQREMPFYSHTENYGIGSFIKAKTIIKVHYIV